jgi:hypothetical protein
VELIRHPLRVGIVVLEMNNLERGHNRESNSSGTLAIHSGKQAAVNQQAFSYKWRMNSRVLFGRREGGPWVRLRDADKPTARL